MDELTTICVGGVGAGQILTGRGNAAMLANTRPFSVRELQEVRAPSEMMTVTKTVYRRMKLTYGNSKGVHRSFEFWVDSNEIHDEFDLIVALANGYRPVRQESL